MLYSLICCYYLNESLSRLMTSVGEERAVLLSFTVNCDVLVRRSFLFLWVFGIVVLPGPSIYLFSNEDSHYVINSLVTN